MPKSATAHTIVFTELITIRIRHAAFTFQICKTFFAEWELYTLRVTCHHYARASLFA